MKKSQIDRAIEQLESERAVLDLAIQKLRQQALKVTRARKPKPVEDMQIRKPG